MVTVGNVVGVVRFLLLVLVLVLVLVFLCFVLVLVMVFLSLTSARFKPTMLLFRLMTEFLWVENEISFLV